MCGPTLKSLKLQTIHQGSLSSHIVLNILSNKSQILIITENILYDLYNKTHLFLENTRVNLIFSGVFESIMSDCNRMNLSQGQHFNSYYTIIFLIELIHPDICQSLRLIRIKEDS